jgi:hypothetical protein
MSALSLKPRQVLAEPEGNSLLDSRERCRQLLLRPPQLKLQFVLGAFELTGKGFLCFGRVGQEVLTRPFGSALHQTGQGSAPGKRGGPSWTRSLHSARAIAYARRDPPHGQDKANTD